MNNYKLNNANILNSNQQTSNEVALICWLAGLATDTGDKLMKVKDFLKEHPEILNDENCSVCQLHTVFPTEAMACPYCGKEIYAGDFDMMPVGTVNSVDEDDGDEEINAFPVGHCRECWEYIALIPTKIIYNGNHDIYYTGGKNYVVEDIPFEGKLLPDIEQYTRRIKEGENLTPNNLETWLEYKVEEIIAEYLFKNGYKR
jgi:hypothetical protein